MEYRARAGTRLTDEQAAEFGPRLAALAESSGGGLTPQDVVLAAERDKGALHDWFQWDDAAAAESFRVFQARQLIGSIMVAVTPGEPPIRAFYNVEVVLADADTEDAERATRYVTLTRVGTQAVLQEQVVARALREARAWRLRYQQYQELGPIVKAILRAERRIAKT